MCMVCLMVLAGCEVDKTIKLNSSSSVELRKNETHQISAESATQITYSSSDVTVAEVGQTGLVTAKSIGDATISLANGNDTKTVKVSVVGSGNLYEEPNINFGDTKDQVKKVLGDPHSDNGVTFVYAQYSYAALALMVDFEGNAVYRYGVLIDQLYVDEVDTFLRERYYYYGEDDGIKIYGNNVSMNNATLVVRFETVQGTTLISYIDPNDVEKGNTILDVAKKIIENCK